MLYQLKDFKIITKLGQGTYGVVHKVRNIITNEIVAIKEFLTPEEDEGIHPTSLREVAILRELQHPYIVCLQQTIIEHGKLYLVFEYLKMDLRKYMAAYGEIDKRTVKIFSYQMMQGLLFCHSKRIMHRDLKPDNLLIDVDNKILKLADFGMARTYGHPVKPLSHEVVTLWYRAPEIMLNTKRYSCSIDVWSAACIIAEMQIGEVLFRGDSEIDQLFVIFKVLGTPNEDVWPDIEEFSVWKSNFPIWRNTLENHLKSRVDNVCIDLLDSMLIYYPKNRVSIMQALYHEYFQDIDKSSLPAADEEKKLCPKVAYQELTRTND